jgi:hypothetical protein
MANEDLLKDVSKPDPDDKDYFLVTITDLDFSKTYPLQFRWVYKNDKKPDEQEWSAVRNLTTPSETPPKAPRLQAGDVIGGEGLIKINWDGKDYLGANLENFDRVDIHIQDAAGNTSTTFGDGTKPTAFFKEAGTKTITCPAGTYTVFLKAVSPLKTKSTASASYTVTVSAATAIEEPTLPNGLSVVTTSFGLTLGWAGTYALGDTFTGFKSIDVFATTTDLGASTTTGLSSSNLVANLTINDTVNKINIGLEVLKQATSTTSTTVYTTGVYIYYIAKNLNDSVYKVSGVPTYTRVNSVAVTPSKANKVDLENGVISIENLEAGNGQFTSWLRAGTGGGARIELNGGAAFTNTGYSVLPGFSVYSTGGTPIFRASLDGVVSFGGYAPSDIASIETTANGKNKVFRQATVPTALSANDIWINTYIGTLVSGGSYKGDNTIFVSNAAGTGGWVLSKDQDITNVVNKTVNFNSGGNIVGPIQIPVNTGSIYSSKSSYGSSTSGWFLGYNGTTPVIDIGSGTAYMRWDGSSLSIKGNVDAGSITSGGTITGVNFQTNATSDGTGVNRYIKINGSGDADRIFFYTTGTTNPGYMAVRSDNILDISPPYSGNQTNRLSMDTGGNSILYGGALDSYIRIGATTAYISKPTTIDGTLQVTESGASGSYNVKRIKSTSTTSTPTGGADGDIVLVWA